MNNIEERLRQIMKSLIKVESIEMEDDMSDLGLNSFIFVKLIIKIEEEFDIDFDDEDLDLDNFKKFRNIVEYINGKLGGDN